MQEDGNRRRCKQDSRVEADDDAGGRGGRERREGEACLVRCGERDDDGGSLRCVVGPLQGGEAHGACALRETFELLAAQREQGEEAAQLRQRGDGGGLKAKGRALGLGLVWRLA